MEITNISIVKDLHRAQDEKEVSLGLFVFLSSEKLMTCMDVVWTCCNQVSVTNSPGFPTALVYPSLEIRSEELGNIPKQRSANH